MHAAWPVEGTEMAERIRGHNWSRTPLGPIDCWPQSFRTAVDLLLASGFPAAIAWGRDAIVLYNDAYGAIIGDRHPSAFGRPTFETFPEVQSSVEPVLGRVWQGATETREDQSYPFIRDGVLRDAWFTISYCPLCDETGTIVGVFTTLIETTARLVADRQRTQAETTLRLSEAHQAFLLTVSDALRPIADPFAIQEVAARLLGEHLAADRVYYAEIDLTTKRARVHREYRRRNDDLSVVGWHAFAAYPTVVASILDGNAFIEPDVARSGRLRPEERAIFGEFAIAAFVLLPLMKGGTLTAELLVTTGQPRAWTESDLGLIEEVGERTWAAVERAHAEAAVRASRAETERQAQFLDTTLANVSDLILMWDRDGHIVYANRALERLWGMTPAQYLGKTTEGLGYPPELNDRFTWEIEQVIQTQTAVSGEVPYTSPTGQFGYFEYVFSPVTGDDGMVEFVACTAHDSTERQQAERELRESEERYRTLFESIDQGFCTIEVILDELGNPVDYTFLEVNPAFERNTGLQGATGKRMRELRPAHEQFWFDAYGRVALSGEPARFEHEAAALDRWYNVYAFRAGEPGKRRVAILFEDITERKRAETAVRESDARFRALADVVPDLLWSNDAAGRATWCNQRMLDYAGMDFDTLRDFGWIDVIHPEDRAEAHQHYQVNVAAGTAFQHEHRLRRHDDVYRWFLLRAEPMLDEAGQAAQWFGTATDIHETRMARNELEGRVATATVELRTLSRRLIEVQEEERRHLARELHDEIGQALTGLQLQLVTSRRGNKEALAEAESIVRELTSRVSALSMDLRPAALDPLGLLPALLWYVERYQVRTGVRVDLRHHGLDRRFAPAVEIGAYRVIQEALTNVARHAGSSAANVHLLADDAILTVVIRDQGNGFDPVTTPSSGGVSGIRERVELLGGSVGFETAPGAGVAVTAELPLDLSTHATHKGAAS